MVASRMDIVLSEVGKRYRYEWIFRELSYTFSSGERYAILGPNGAGKSTLMKILSGHLSPSKGQIQFQNGTQSLESDLVYRQVSYAAPYIDLIEELNLEEVIRFHRRFKPFLNNLQTDDLIELLGFQKSRQKPIQFFSSGMKQRLKLVLAICSDTPLLLLDEPTSNLDRQGFAWYHELVEQFAGNRLLIVASNEEWDYQFCNHHLQIMDYKKKKGKS